MTAVSMPGTIKPRTKGQRRLRHAGSVGGVTLFAGALCLLFIMPLIYMFVAAFDDSRTMMTAGAPLYPAKVRTFDCEEQALCTYTTAFGEQSAMGRQLDIYQVPITDENGKTEVKELALVLDISASTGKPSIFIDPATHKQVLVVVDVLQLTPAWTFSLTLDNFNTAAGWAQTIADGGFATFFYNTGFIAVFGTIGATISAIIVAYGFARFKIPYRDTLFLILIGTILLPFQVTLIPQFLMWNFLGMTATADWVTLFGLPIVPLAWIPLILPHYFSNAYNVFLLRQYFLTLPRELDEAAMMDGATPFRILISVIIPQSWPAIMSVVLFHFFFAWNDFLGPLIYLTGKPNLYPIAIGLNYFNTTFRVANAPAAIQAGALLSLLLPVAIFFLAQRVFMRGVVISGVEK